MISTFLNSKNWWLYSFGTLVDGGDFAKCSGMKRKITRFVFDHRSYFEWQLFLLLDLIY